MIVGYNVQHNFDKARAFKGVYSSSTRVDLMIVDIPKDLFVPMVSSPPTSVPQWNSVDKKFLPWCLILEVHLSMTIGCFSLPQGQS